jgi:hypothetical protein
MPGDSEKEQAVVVVEEDTEITEEEKAKALAKLVKNDNATPKKVEMERSSPTPAPPVPVPTLSPRDKAGTVTVPVPKSPTEGTSKAKEKDEKSTTSTTPVPKPPEIPKYGEGSSANTYTPPPPPPVSSQTPTPAVPAVDKPKATVSGVTASSVKDQTSRPTLTMPAPPPSAPGIVSSPTSTSSVAPPQVPDVKTPLPGGTPVQEPVRVVPGSKAEEKHEEAVPPPNMNGRPEPPKPPLGQPSASSVTGPSGQQANPPSTEEPDTIIKLRPGITPSPAPVEKPETSVAQAAALSKPAARNLQPLGAPTTTPSTPRSVAAPADPAQLPTTRDSEVLSYDEEKYTVGANDTFRSISQNYYKDAKYEKALMLFNQKHPLAEEEMKANQPMLRSGQAVYIPPAGILDRYYGSAVTESSSSVAPSAVPRDSPERLRPAAVNLTGMDNPPVANKGLAKEKVYRVQGSEELIWDIAKRTLGKGERWPEIIKLNAGLDTTKPVPAGSELRLPSDARVEVPGTP